MSAMFEITLRACKHLSMKAQRQRKTKKLEAQLKYGNEKWASNIYMQYAPGKFTCRFVFTTGYDIPQYDSSCHRMPVELLADSSGLSSSSMELSLGSS